MPIEILNQDKNLFPDIEWSKPLNKRQSGRLLIIGGNRESFRNVVKSFEAAMKNEALNVALALPDRLERVLPKLDNIFFLKSTPSGSISEDNDIEELIDQSDHILLAGDLTKNSQTQLFIEKLITFSVPITFSDDCDYYLQQIGLQEKNLVFNFKSLQKILIKSQNKIQIKSTMGDIGFAEALLEINQVQGINIVSNLADNVFVCADGKVSKTEIKKVNFTDLAVKTAVNSMHFPDKSFAALNSAVWECADTEKES